MALRKRAEVALPFQADEARGVSLLGVDSGYTGLPTRQRVWERLASDLKPRHLHEITRTIELDALPSAFDGFLQVRIKGRTVVKVID